MTHSPDKLTKLSGELAMLQPAPELPPRAVVNTQPYSLFSHLSMIISDNYIDGAFGPQGKIAAFAGACLVK